MTSSPRFANLALLALLLAPGAALGQAVAAAKLTAADAAADDHAGLSVSLSGTRALVGAPFKNGPGGSSGWIAGAAFIHERQADGSWLQVAKLTPADALMNDQFGASVSLSGDRAIIGAAPKAVEPVFLPKAGVAYVFERQASGVWLQVARLSASDAAPNDFFGCAVAISGGRAVVGAYGDDIAGFGSNGGSAYLFERQASGAWIQVAKLNGSDTAGTDFFGWAVAISGDRAVVGAYHNTTPAALHTGSAYVFERQGDGTWPQVAKLIASDASVSDEFGKVVAISGTRAVIGAPSDDVVPAGPEAGSAFVFERQASGAWLQVAKLTASDGTFYDEFGFSVAVDGNVIVAGAHKDNPPGAADGGSAYFFERQSDGTWLQVAKVLAADGASQDFFGESVSVSGERALIGAWSDDLAAGADAGSAHVFRLASHALAAYGTGTPGCAGTLTVGVTLPPEVGAAGFAFTCDHAPASQLGIGIVTDSKDLSGSDPFALGILFHADLLFATQILTVNFTSDASGNALAPAAIPNNPFLVGQTFYAMAIWAWTSCTLPGFNPLNLSTSRGLAVTIQAGT